MGSKKAKAGKKDTKEINIDWSKYPPHVTEVCHPNFYFGYEKFKFKNGDSYEGEFCAHRCGIVWREGKGTYKTKDGHYYEGKWENDQLLSSQDTVIKYPDGIIYEGNVVHGKYSGLGTYIVRKNIYISSYFENNRPTGEVLLLDPNGNYWRGQITNTEEVLLLPDNHFYSNLTYLNGRGKEIEIDTKNSSKTSYRSLEKIDPEVLKQLVFKKSTKTVNNFKETLLEEKLLSEDDVRKPLKKKKSSQLKAKFGSNKSLLELFWSKEYRRNTCLPVPVIYPTVDIEAREAVKNENFEEKI